MITIDGTYGEGGGQIIRTSLALSMVTGKPFQITNIRGGRKKPGLLRQHLTAVKACTEVCAAKAEGAFLNSRDLYFEPGKVKHGEYRFAIGTAGSTVLVLQTILPALMCAREGRSTIFLEGGTHNAFAPPFDFLERTFLPVINQLGPKIEVHLERYGFYPAGGGSFRANITPSASLKQIEIMERGEIMQKQAKALVSKLSLDIAHRELKQVKDKLSWDKSMLYAHEIIDSRGPGNVVMLEVKHNMITEICTAFGAPGVSAKTVASRAIDDLKRYLCSNAPVGIYLADQLLAPMAIAGAGKFITCAPTKHTLTNAEIIKEFLDVSISIEKMDTKTWEVEIK